jgi:hypothetical protein
MTPPPTLKGFITTADLPSAEQEWPGLQAFFRRLPAADRPETFLELVWRFERAGLRGATSDVGAVVNVVQIPTTPGCGRAPGYLPHLG